MSMDFMIMAKGLGKGVSNIKWIDGIIKTDKASYNRLLAQNCDSCNCGGTEISIDLMLISKLLYLSVLV